MASPLTPIVLLLTPRARALSAHLPAHGLSARPISWPTVPKGMDRVRVCLHAGNTRAEIDALVPDQRVYSMGCRHRAGRANLSGGGSNANRGGHE
jgi:hypothetical protein